LDCTGKTLLSWQSRTQLVLRHEETARIAFSHLGRHRLQRFEKQAGRFYLN
jgi:hypothetical protein